MMPQTTLFRGLNGHNSISNNNNNGHNTTLFNGNGNGHTHHNGHTNLFQQNNNGHATKCNGHNGIDKVKDIYIEMTDIVDKFNELFGPQLFLLGIYCSTLIVEWSVSLAYITIPSKKKIAQHPDEFHILLIDGIIKIFLMPIWLTIAMYRCDMAVEESEEIITICYEIQMNYAVFTEPYQNLKKFIYEIDNSRIKFSAMGYYEISRSSILGLIGGASTYFVAVIQFYDRADKKNNNTGKN